MTLRRFIFLGLSSLLFASCGQVGSITGGEQDISAPRVVTEKVKPPNKSTNIYPQRIIIPFDEFITFNKPAENILVTPKDVKLDYSLKGKTVYLDVIEGDWEPNTTYSIFLNRAIKDITEGNDSIISYVFSTGNYIDSLQTALQVIDAYSGKPAKNSTVGLYAEPLTDDTSKINPRYFSITDKEGIAIFRNIKDAPFYAYAFEDENRNNRLDAFEKRAALLKPVALDTVLDSILPQIRLMPAEKHKISIKNNEILPISRWSLSFDKAFEKEDSLLFLEVPHYVEWNKRKDSVVAFYKDSLFSGNLTAVIKTKNQQDTISKRIFFKNPPTLTLQNNLVQNKLLVTDTLLLKANEIIQSIDTSLFYLSINSENDSLPIHLPFKITSLNPYSFQINFAKQEGKTMKLTILPDGIKGTTQSLKDSLILDFSLQAKKETGNMLIEWDTLPEYGILYITGNNNKVIYEVKFNGIDKSTHEITGVQPGKYGFYYLIDTDRNGVWSTGSIFEDKEPETIIWFEETTTIRANWDVKTKLSFR